MFDSGSFFQRAFCCSAQPSHISPISRFRRTLDKQRHTMPRCKTLAKSYLYVINTLFILVGLATLAASVTIAAQDR